MHSKAILCLAIVLALASASFAETSLNMRPIIGILAQPYQSDNSPYSYIAASYVKYVESAGARVVPIFYNSTQEQLKSLFSQINGIIFPGGGSELVRTPLFYSAQYLYKLVLDANDRGVHFPLFGHCMGFQLLSMITSEDFDILEREEVEDQGLPLNFTRLAPTSRLFKDAPQWVMKTLGSQPVTMNYHHWGISKQRYHANAKLDAFYDVLSTNVDDHGDTFVSTVEGKRYPVYGYQWHPEKNAFEWSGHINHSPEAVAAMQYMADFTVSEARKNFQSFKNPTDEFNSLIYNYCPRYTAATSTSFVQSYIF
jgi:gamma-glutamyl hydrolase